MSDTASSGIASYASPVMMIAPIFVSSTLMVLVVNSEHIDSLNIYLHRCYLNFVILEVVKTKKTSAAANIHTQLMHDCVVLGSFALCYLLLSRDAHYPWFILVPDRPEISEIYQLSKEDQALLLAESSYLGEHLMTLFAGDKLNIAALGNVVPQLHVHHVVRYKSDSAWPAPVWGYQPVKPYTEKQFAELIKKITRSGLQGFTSIS